MKGSLPTKGRCLPHRAAQERILPLTDVNIDLPCRPGKFIALWNNYHAQAVKQNLAIPAEPLYFVKTPNSYCAHEHTVPQPVGYDGRVVYEGELGVVIGKRCKNASEEQAGQAIFGYTCINDITALDLIAKDASFAQWTRAKCFDGFGVIGPVIATGLDWKIPERQNPTQWQGTPELSLQRHDIFTGADRACAEPGHDTGAGRRDRLRHIAGGIADETGICRRSAYRGYRHVAQHIRGIGPGLMF